MLGDIVAALELIQAICGIYQQLKEGDVLARRLCERVQLLTDLLRELKTNCANPRFRPTASMRNSMAQLKGVLGETKDFLIKNSTKSKSFFDSVKRMITSVVFRNKFTSDLNSLNQRINDCVNNLNPSLGLNFEEQRRGWTRRLSRSK